MTMMCPTTYFNENFKGKSEKEQKREIKKLEKKIKELEKACDTGFKPSPSLTLKVTKMYLEYAKKALSNNIEVENVKELTLDNVFTIESKKDPFWEKEAKKIIQELDDSLSIKSTYCGFHYFFSDIIAALKNKNISELEEFLRKENVKLPEAKTTRDAILRIIIDKVSKVS